MGMCRALNETHAPPVDGGDGGGQATGDRLGETPCPPALPPAGGEKKRGERGLEFSNHRPLPLYPLNDRHRPPLVPLPRHAGPRRRVAADRQRPGAADDGELYLQYKRSEAFGFDDGRLKTASYDTHSGFGLRAVSGEMTAFAHANELSEAAIQRAAQTMALIDPAKGAAAPPPQGTNRHLYTATDPLDLIPFAEKVSLCQTIDAARRARDPRVVQVSVGLSGSWSVVEIVRPTASSPPMCGARRLNISVVVEQNGRRETGSFGIGGRYLYDRLVARETWERGIDVALIRRWSISTRSPPCGRDDGAARAGLPGVLLHEAIGHGLEGDFNRKGTSAFSGRIGERVAAPGVTVVDDGSLADRRGSLSIDDEGTPTREVVLIEDGILKGYMQDRLNARLMGVAPTGNGRREASRTRRCRA